MSSLPLALALALSASTSPSPAAPPFGEADLSPLLDPSLDAALAAFEAERWEEAARALAAVDRPAARLLRGMARCESWAAIRGLDLFVEP